VGLKLGVTLFRLGQAKAIILENAFFQIQVAIETSLALQRPQVFTEKPKDVKPRKKYVKEAWPGKRPAPALLV